MINYFVNIFYSKKKCSRFNYRKGSFKYLSYRPKRKFSSNVTTPKVSMYTVYWFLFFCLLIILLVIYIFFKIWIWWTYVEPPLYPPLNCYRSVPLNLEEHQNFIKWSGLDTLPSQLNAMFNPTAYVTRSNTFESIPHCFHTSYLDFPEHFTLNRRVGCTMAMGRSLTGDTESFIKVSISVWAKCGFEGTRLALVLFKSIHWDLNTLIATEYINSSLGFKYDFSVPVDGFIETTRVSRLTWSDIYKSISIILDQIDRLNEDPEYIRLKSIYRYREFLKYNDAWFGEYAPPQVYSKYDGAAFG